MTLGLGSASPFLPDYVMKNLYFIVAAAVICLGCQRKDSGMLSILIDASSDTQAYLSEIAEKVDEIELEVTDKSLIHQIRHVETLNNHYFIRHHVYSEVLMFDAKGRFVRQVGRIGRGPGEYTASHQIVVDREHQRLLLSTQGGVMVFDDNGAFVQSIQLGRMPESMLVLNKQLYCTHNNVYLDQSREATVYLTTHNTTDWNLIDSVFHTSFTGLHFFSPFLSQSNQSVYFYYPDAPARAAGTSSGVDTLHRFENQKPTPYFTAQVKGKGRVVRILMTDNYGIITYATSVYDPNAGKSRTVYSQYYLNLRSMKGRNATNGFIDDFYGNNDVIITPIPNTNLFYYHRENNDYSPDLRTTPNPTLYIGTFKE